MCVSVTRGFFSKLAFETQSKRLAAVQQMIINPALTFWKSYKQGNANSLCAYMHTISSNQCWVVADYL